MEVDVRMTALCQSPGIETGMQHDFESTLEQHRSLNEPSDGSGGQEFSLARADGGKDAFLFLAGSFVIEALVWGFPFSFGLFQEYYSSHEPFASNPGGIAVIGTTASGIMYLGCPVIFYVYGKWPWARRWSSMIGLPILATSIVAASFAETVWQLILTQGVGYAIGGALLYCPLISYMNEWFVQRKGLAYGVMWAGTGLSGAIIPFIMNAGLSRYGHRTILRAWAVGLVALTLPLFPYMKPRIPISYSIRSRPFDLSFLSSSFFWTLQGCNILQGLGYFIPGVYLPTFAEKIGASTIGGTLAVALFNGASVFGAIFVGWLTDRFHVTSVLLAGSIAAALSVLIGWGLSISLPILAVFSVLYGFSAGGSAVTWTGIIRTTQKSYVGADAGLIFGLLAAGRGIGAVASGPLSEALLASDGWVGSGGFAYGTGYGSLIVFTGTTALAGTIAWGTRMLGMI